MVVRLNILIPIQKLGDIVVLIAYRESFIKFDPNISHLTLLKKVQFRQIAPHWLLGEVATTGVLDKLWELRNDITQVVNP